MKKFVIALMLLIVSVLMIGCSSAEKFEVKSTIDSVSLEGNKVVAKGTINLPDGAIITIIPNVGEDDFADQPLQVFDEIQTTVQNGTWTTEHNIDEYAGKTLNISIFFENLLNVQPEPVNTLVGEGGELMTGENVIVSEIDKKPYHTYDHSEDFTIR